MTSRTIGFDLDQTLVDTQERIVGSFRSALRAMQRPDVDAEAFRPWFGYPLGQILAQVSPGADEAVFTPLYRQAYDVDRPGAIAPMPGAVEALEWLHANGFRSFVVSAKNTPAVEASLADAGLAHLLDGFRGDLFGEQKAIPIQEEKAAFYVGDHIADMHAASLAGAVGIAVVSGGHDEHALRDAGAAAVIRTLAELPEVVTRLS
ncbi:HAD family hydrolase [Arsenicicoccus dermatophilus]|uniref:HAD family hydrolase n=1 Tax=Arsenicicoccus dermatophilus TaxID=1076331 RepID=UPI0039172F77